jgi:DNA-binding MltR family transcriptional regulator
MTKRKAKTSDPEQAKLARLVEFFRHTQELFFGTSTRGAITLATALIDESLDSLLRDWFATFSETKKSQSLLNEVLSHRGAVGSLYARVRVARMVELIDDNIFDAIEYINNVRNSAAHDALITKYSQSSGSDLLAKLRKDNAKIVQSIVKRIPGDDEGRKIFVACCVGVLFSIWSEHEVVRESGHDISLAAHRAILKATSRILVDNLPHEFLI